MSMLGPLKTMHRPEVKSSADQCDLLVALPLKKFPKLLSKVKIVYDCHYDESVTDPEDSDMQEKTDLDSSFQITQDDTTTDDIFNKYIQTLVMKLNK